MTSRDSTRPIARRLSRWSGFVCLGLAAAALGGCSGGSDGSAGGAGRLVAGYDNVENAPWRDFDAAVSSALLRSELAVVERRIISPTERRWVLLSAQDEPGWLTVTVPGPWTEPWDPAVVYACGIGHFGAPEREKAFVEAIRQWRPKHTR